MKTIQFKTDYYEIVALIEIHRAHPPTGTAVEALLARSILDELCPKLVAKKYAWDCTKKKKRTITWSNHIARAVAVYLTRINYANSTANDFDRTCLRMMLMNLTQKLA